MRFALLRDRLILGANMDGAVVILISSRFSPKIVFNQICKNRKGTVRFALFQDRLIFGALISVPDGILIFCLSF